MRNDNQGYGSLSETPYGDPLKWTTVEQILSLRNHKEVQNHSKSRAAFAYLAELPATWRVILYWH